MSIASYFNKKNSQSNSNIQTYHAQPSSPAQLHSSEKHDNMIESRFQKSQNSNQGFYKSDSYQRNYQASSAPLPQKTPQQTYSTSFNSSTPPPTAKKPFYSSSPQSSSRPSYSSGMPMPSSSWKQSHQQQYQRSNQYYKGYNQQRNFSSTSSQSLYSPSFSQIDFSLITRNSFSAKCNPICDAVMNIFKRIPGRHYDGEMREWIFPLSQHDNLSAILCSEYYKSKSPSSGYAINKLNVLPKSVLRVFSKYMTCTEENPQPPPLVATPSEVRLMDRMPLALRSALFPFQEEGVLFLLRREGRGMIGDEMGLGKTLQALAVASVYHNEWPLLVICPSTLRFQWSEAIEKWCAPFVDEGGVKVIMSQMDEVTGKESAVVISYQMCVNQISSIVKARFGVIIADESHQLKNGKSQRAKVILPLIQTTKRAVMLTGTPAINRPVELFSQISCLRRDLFPTMAEFGRRYCEMKQMPRWVDYSGATNLKELHLLLEETVMIRRLKKNVLTQLPKKSRVAIYLNIGENKMKELKEAVKEATEAATARKREIVQSLNLSSGLSSSSASSSFGSGGFGQSDKSDDIADANTIIKQYQLTGKAKLDAVCEYLHDQLEKKEKFLVFAHHRIVMDGICQIFESNDDYIRIDGDTPAADRHMYVRYFQEEERCKAAVLSLKAASTGLTLTEASRVIFAELSWTPGVLVQAEDRVHRIGQFNPVCVTYLLAKGTVDEAIWAMIQKKLEVIGDALNGNKIRLQASTEERVVNMQRLRMLQGKKALMMIGRGEMLDDNMELFNEGVDGGDFDAGSQLRDKSQSQIVDFFKPVFDVPDPNKVEGAEKFFEDELEQRLMSEDMASVQNEGLKGKNSSFASFPSSSSSSLSSSSSSRSNIQSSSMFGGHVETDVTREGEPVRITHFSPNSLRTSTSSASGFGSSSKTGTDSLQSNLPVKRQDGTIDPMDIDATFGMGCFADGDEFEPLDPKEELKDVKDSKGGEFGFDQNESVMIVEDNSIADLTNEEAFQNPKISELEIEGNSKDEQKNEDKEEPTATKPEQMSPAPKRKFHDLMEIYENEGEEEDDSNVNETKIEVIEDNERENNFGNLEQYGKSRKLSSEEIARQFADIHDNISSDEMKLPEFTINTGFSDVPFPIDDVVEGPDNDEWT
ncbi:uncharacterized protein MONOS_6718 [Monocercomonoides exilis]|uniref:uncharacterized protein n=1 Tax=Monocercomonoides exilis TaxID=2049356 RepID=UPI00355A701F|nr:hypothetical protein MONOS_6718 [Monocercomonoides exilis]|eukprot:MONOS_6718.1-p1 / transcript=MONOS_6718.1 / gene=MONOS_6718 / organism=Monocercomonoides_exilis_PA203 / gene_product=SWI / transcript_product=SWI / location=Mono_scaffold00216:73486-77017(-) / protein_length=1151 / sequence_SO=supercontig / SO=protein_coding / is_pseudo=false